MFVGVSFASFLGPTCWPVDLARTWTAALEPHTVATGPPPTLQKKATTALECLERVFWTESEWRRAPRRIAAESQPRQQQTPRWHQSRAGTWPLHDHDKEKGKKASKSAKFCERGDCQGSENGPAMRSSRAIADGRICARSPRREGSGDAANRRGTEWPRQGGPWIRTRPRRATRVRGMRARSMLGPNRDFVLTVLLTEI
jgi:hypothetical protein